MYGPVGPGQPSRFNPYLNTSGRPYGQIDLFITPGRHCGPSTSPVEQFRGTRDRPVGGRPAAMPHPGTSTHDRHRQFGAAALRADQPTTQGDAPSAAVACVAHAGRQIRMFPSVAARCCWSDRGGAEHPGSGLGDEVGREAEAEAGCRFQPQHQLWRQRDRSAAQVVLQLVDGPRTDDRQHAVAVASTVGRFRKGSRSRPGENTHPETQRTYVLRSYLRCDLCNHRTYGSTRKRKGRSDDIYYRCTPNRRHCGHLPWFATHPPHVLVREDQLLEPLASFFKERVFGAARKALTAETGAAPSVNAELAARKAQLLAELVELRQRQDNLLGELENLVPSGDADVDAAWRAGIQRRFAAAVADQRAKARLLDEITGEAQAAAPMDVNLLDQLPTSQIDLARLDEDHQRWLYDAFHLEMRYHALDRTVTIRVTITAETLPALAATAEAIIGNLPNAKGRGPERELRPPANAVEMHGVPPAGQQSDRRWFESLAGSQSLVHEFSARPCR
jgi:hypothetical protein